MKRLFGLIGLVYLFTLAAVFYFNLSTVIIFLSFSVIIAALIIKLIKHNFKCLLLLIALPLSALAAILSLFLYQNIVYKPVVEKYSNKEINFTAYVADEPVITGKSVSYVLAVDSADGEKADIKILLKTYRELYIDEFDKVTGSAVMSDAVSGYLKSEGIFLCADTTVDFKVDKTGETHINPYTFIVELRKWIKSVLNTYFNGSELGMVYAITLGEKSALPKAVRNAFASTGASYLIVVSGMHLTFALSVFTLISKKFGMRLPLLIICYIFIILYVAVTGFAPPVIRAGIMQIIVLGGSFTRRQHDSINSLGIAALALTIGNPFSVGNIGIILSFTATLGILLWANQISYAITRIIRLDRLNKKVFDMKKNGKSPKLYLFLSLLLKIPNFIISLFSISVSAAVWVMPVSVMAFGKISVLIVLLSLIAEPLAAIILWCALLTVVLSFIPFVPGIIAWAGTICCKWLISSVMFFSKLPFSSLNADKPYIYIWLASTALFAVFGYIMWYYRRKGAFYPFCVIFLSALTLLSGYTVTWLFRDKNCYLTIFNDGGGITAGVRQERYFSLLSCGGSLKNYSANLKAMNTDSVKIDMLVIPRQTRNYTGLFSEFSSEFDVNKVFVYDNTESESKFDYEKSTPFPENSTFSLKLNPTVTDRVFASDSFACQYIYSKSKTVLFLTAGSDISKLPEELRTADYIISATAPKHAELLSCDTLYFLGDENSLKKHTKEFDEAAENTIIAKNQTITIKM